MTEQVYADRLRARHLPALDGWRGVAVLAVMLFHLWPYHRGNLVWFASFGWMGVDLFFVLSGFLITRILLAARDGPHYFRNFYARRTLRIFPLYYGVVIAVSVVWPLMERGHPPVRAVLAHAAVALAYVTNLWQCYWTQWYTARPPFLVGHFWSLAIEEQFYLVWPIIVFAVPGRRGLLAACGGCVAVTVVARASAWASGADPMVPFTFSLCRLDGLGLGAALAVAATDLRWAAVARRICAVALAVTAPAMVAIGLAAGTWNHAASPLVRTAGLAISAPLCASALYLTVTSPRGAPTDRILSAAPLRWMGRYSYGLYVYHGLLAGVLHDEVGLRILHHLHRPWMADPCCFVASTTLSAAVAVASYHLFEKPALRLKRFFPEPPPGRATTSVPAVGNVVAVGAGERI